MKSWETVMKLESVRIENFKCIDDSEEFSLKQVNCFVGKNEAGKSAILQAIYKLNGDIPENSNFKETEYPRRRWSKYQERHETSPDNVLTTKWSLEEGDIAELDRHFGSDILINNKIKIFKGYNNRRTWTIQIDEQRIISNILGMADLNPVELSDFDGLDTIDEIISKLKSYETSSQSQTNLLEYITEKFPEGNSFNAVASVLKEKLPTFLYFADYHKMAGSVSLDDLNQRINSKNLEMGHRIFIALLRLAGRSPEEIDSIERFENLQTQLEGVQNRLTDEIFEYWSQNKYLEVTFQYNQGLTGDPPPFNSGFIFRTRIRNNRHRASINFSERSAGFVWFFSFLVWFSQVRKEYGENLIILLDDPGLSLHARAQADLLRYFNEKLKPYYQVLYTTHSPFMIDPDNLINVRTVEDVVTEDEKFLGTKVGDRVLATDHDTLFPLQAALGYDVTQTLFVSKNNLLVEGPSDLLYLKWFSRILHEREKVYLDDRWVIVPCGGIGKIGSFMRLFGGSELNVAVLTDYHYGIKRQVRSLRESELFRAVHLFSAEMYVDSDDADIEDIIGRHLYITLINKCYSLDDSEKIPYNTPADAPDRVVEEVENHFKNLPIRFDHYKPALYLTGNPSTFQGKSTKLDEALKRFEALFKDLNESLD